MESMWMLGLFSLFTITILLVEVALVINVPLVIRHGITYSLASSQSCHTSNKQEGNGLIEGHWKICSPRAKHYVARGPPDAT